MKNKAIVDRFEPRFPHSVAAAACIAAALTLLWPLLDGQILLGGARSDMYIAGYSFRLFGAEWFKETGSIPQWNPYLFGGLPYIGAMHGDIFYPTAWLRWIMPTDLAITWGMAVHFVLAGWLTYRFTRALGMSWGAALFAGVAYELSGIVASQMSPGHDGKLFVSAHAPLAFWVLLIAIRQRKDWAFGAFAIVVALTVLGHYHMSYFLLIALGLWALYLVFWDPERDRSAKPLKPLLFSLAAVIVGVGITSLQALPFFEYIPYSPRADGGQDTGWQFATSFAFPPTDLPALILPEFNGVLEHYWGANPFKFHTEYVGFLPLALGAVALGWKQYRRLVIALSVGILFFLFLSFAGHTPFYRPFYELLPLLKKIRAMGMVFYLSAFLLSVLAGIGMERLLRGEYRASRTLFITGAFALIALLGATGGLQRIVETMASNERFEQAYTNAPELKRGALRLLVMVLLGGAALWAAAAGRIKGALAVASLSVLMTADLWTIDRKFYVFSPRASELFRTDAVTAHLQNAPLPYRVLDPAGSYRDAILMAYRIPNALGYHGFTLQKFNELAGRESGFRNILSPSIMDLLAIRFIILPVQQSIPGYHEVVGPTQTPFGTTAVLYERDTLPMYARVVTTAAKIPESNVVETLVDPRFPVTAAALYPDTSTVSETTGEKLLLSSRVASVVAWEPGKMIINISGTDTSAGYLIVSENWYKDWTAIVDGKPGVVRRANHSLISVDLPGNAKEVVLEFKSSTYALGKLLSVVFLVVAVAMMVTPVMLARRREGLKGETTNATA